MRIVVPVGCVLLTLFVTLSGSEAEACSPIPCMDPATTAPAVEDSVPQNARAYVVAPKSAFLDPTLDAGVELVDSDGGIVPVASTRVSNDIFLVPQVQLEAGAQYALRFGSTCPQGGWPPVDAGTVFDVPFTVGPPAPLPERSATISIVAVEEQNLAGFNSCGGPGGRIVEARLKFTPTEAMRPWLPMARWKVLVDGSQWARSDWGALAADGTLGFSFSNSVRGLTRVHAQCPAEDAGGSGDPGVRPGRHNVRIEAEIAGFDGGAVPSETIEVPLLCESGLPEGSGALGGYDPPADSGCGCSSGGGAATLLGFGVMLLLLVRLHPRGGLKGLTVRVASSPPRA